jgi:hypothetical protein
VGRSESLFRFSQYRQHPQRSQDPFACLLSGTDRNLHPHSRQSIPSSTRTPSLRRNIYIHFHAFSSLPFYHPRAHALVLAFPKPRMSEITRSTAYMNVLYEHRGPTVPPIRPIRLSGVPKESDIWVVSHDFDAIREPRVSSGSVGFYKKIWSKCCPSCADRSEQRNLLKIIHYSAIVPSRVSTSTVIYSGSGSFAAYIELLHTSSGYYQASSTADYPFRFSLPLDNISSGPRVYSPTRYHLALPGPALAY